MTLTFKQVAVAAIAAVSFASAHAVSIPNVTDSFTLGADISKLLASLGTVVLQAQGTATFAGSTLTMPASSTTTSNSNATDLITFANGAGLKITSGANVIALSDLSFNNATKSVDAVISLNGAQTFTGTALTSATDSILTSQFLVPDVSGVLTSGSMKLSAGASTALATALGFSFLAQGLQGYDFGTFKVVGPVPEPSTYAMMGLGLVGIALTARKRKAS